MGGCLSEPLPKGFWQLPEVYLTLLARAFRRPTISFTGANSWSVFETIRRCFAHTDAAVWRAQSLPGLIQAGFSRLRLRYSSFPMLPFQQMCLLEGKLIEANVLPNRGHSF